MTKADAWGPLDRRTRVAVTVVWCLALGLRLWATTGEWIHDWDEAYHALVAKNLARHPLEPTLHDDPERFRPPECRTTWPWLRPRSA